MTIIDENFLKNDFDFNLKQRLRGESGNVGASIRAILKQVYYDLIALCCRDDCRVSTVEDVEARLDSDFKREMFCRAQAYQLIYQMANGKNSLIQPENNDPNAKAWDYCADSVRILRTVLGFNQPTLFTQRG